MVFFEMDLISYTSFVFSKTVVDLSGSFADVERLAGREKYRAVVK